jgi:hypothetical protein
MDMQVKLICQCSYIYFADVSLEKGCENTRVLRGSHARAIVPEIVDDRSIRDRPDPSIPSDLTEHLEQLGATVKASISAVGSVLGSIDLPGVDDLVAHAKRASDLSGILDFLVRHRAGPAGDGEDPFRAQGFARDREENRAVDAAGQRHENSAVFPQQ